MSKLKHALRLGSLGCILLPLSATAELTWNGFISVGGGIADPDSGSSLGGYEDDITFNNENVLGLQLRGDISDKLSATGQLVARGVDGYDAEMAWAYVAYEASDNLKFKLGRIRTPLYLYSDFLEVGYAYQWVSPPDVIYSSPIDSIDGIDVVYQTQLGKIDTTIQAYFGSFGDSVENAGTVLDIDFRNQVGIVGTATYDWLTLRASVQDSKGRFNNWGSIQLPAPLGSFENVATILGSLPTFLVGDAAAKAARSLMAEDVGFLYAEVAAKAEINNWLFVTEFTRLSVDDGPFADQRNYYASVGYTFDDWTIHFTHGEVDEEAADLTSGIPVIPGVTDGLIQVLDGITSSVADKYSTDTIGLRYDFTPGAAFKIEYSDIDNEKAVGGNVLRFVVDAVF